MPAKYAMDRAGPLPLGHTLPLAGHRHARRVSKAAAHHAPQGMPALRPLRLCVKALSDRTAR
ncbi:MAG: hypothetical protein JNJ64_07200 [Flavobacteriales bacterium]|nr:hypothetical protein [Flavobacteriales bacterium]